MSAYVQSKGAISDFRAALSTFVVEARQALAALAMEARRAQEYITHDQAQAWQSEARRSHEEVAQCNLAIHNARTFKRIGEYTPSCIDEKKDLDRAERRLRLAEAKIEAVRHWGRVSEQAIREFQARLAQFISILDGDLPKAIAAMERILASLDQYFAVQAPIAQREHAADARSIERAAAAAVEERPSADGIGAGEEPDEPRAASAADDRGGDVERGAEPAPVSREEPQ
jgi:hypothetical protein